MRESSRALDHCSISICVTVGVDSGAHEVKRIQLAPVVKRDVTVQKTARTITVRVTEADSTLI